MKKIASLFLALTLCLGLAIPAVAADTYSTYTLSYENGTVVTFEAARVEERSLIIDWTFGETGAATEPTTATVVALQPGSNVSVKDAQGENTYITTIGFRKTDTYYTPIDAVVFGVYNATAEQVFTSDGGDEGLVMMRLVDDDEGAVYLIIDDAAPAAADDASPADATDTTPAETPAETPTETTTTVNPFTDVAETSPYRDAILWAVEKNITKGTTDTTFAPSNTCTHNHILTFLWRSNGSPAATIENPFDNIDVNGDFGKAALWAAEQKLVEGTSFPGTDACTRSQTVTYLWKLAGSPETEVSDKFTDVAADADYAQAVAWAVAQGITQGTTDTTFSPDATCTRGQIVTFLYRAQQAAQTTEAASETPAA